jgi:hypothetical protein
MIGQVEKSEKDEQAKANLCYPFDLSIAHNEPAPPIKVGCHSKYVIYHMVQQYAVAEDLLWPSSACAIPCLT